MKATIRMQLANNLLSIDNARRTGLGLALGLLIIIPLSFMLGSGQKITSDIVFDSEIIAVPTLPKNQEAQKESDETQVSVTDDKASNYPFFLKNRAGLTQAQMDAITGGTPLLSIILTHVGGQKDLNDYIVKTLPHDVTLSVSPYLKNHHDVLGQFHSHGFEIWMNAAAVTLDMNRDAGPLALNPTLDFESNIDLLTNQFGNKDHITGVTLPPRSLIIETPSLWQSLVNDLYGQGYGVIDNTRQVTRPSLFFYNDQKAPYIKSDEALEQDISLADLSARLDRIAEKLAETNSMIVTIPVSSPKHIDILAGWIETLQQDKEITIVSVSAQADL